MSDVLDLSESWGILRPEKDTSSITTSVIDEESLLSQARFKAQFDVEVSLGKHPELAQDRAGFIRLCFEELTKHYRELLQQNYLEVFLSRYLSDPGLEIKELASFVQAIPAKVMNRVLSRIEGCSSATALHGLLSIEFWRREDPTRHYALYRDVGVPCVRVTTAKGDMSFRLTEKFDLTVQ